MSKSYGGISDGSEHLHTRHSSVCGEWISGGEGSQDTLSKQQKEELLSVVHRHAIARYPNLRVSKQWPQLEWRNVQEAGIHTEIMQGGCI